MKGLNMSFNLSENDKNLLQFNLIEGPENAASIEVQVDLEEERRQLEERAKVEEFWAGRNLAARNSTRRAA
jgi:hypothetical protein